MLLGAGTTASTIVSLVYLREVVWCKRHDVSSTPSLFYMDTAQAGHQRGFESFLIWHRHCSHETRRWLQVTGFKGPPTCAVGRPVSFLN